MFSQDVKELINRDIFKEEVISDDHDCDGVLQSYTKIWNSVSPNKLSKSPNL